MATNKLTAADVKLVNLDGELTHKVRCPKCGTWGYADDDQFFGRVSLRCGNPGCDFHIQQDLSELTDPAEVMGLDDEDELKYGE